LEALNVTFVQPEPKRLKNGKNESQKIGARAIEQSHRRIVGKALHTNSAQ